MFLMVKSVRLTLNDIFTLFSLVVGGGRGEGRAGGNSVKIRSVLHMIFYDTKCYVVTKYLNYLLTSKEVLGWVPGVGLGVGGGG